MAAIIGWAHRCGEQTFVPGGPYVGLGSRPSPSPHEPDDSVADGPARSEGDQGPINQDDQRFLPIALGDDLVWATMSVRPDSTTLARALSRIEWRAGLLVGPGDGTGERPPPG